MASMVMPTGGGGAVGAEGITEIGSPSWALSGDRGSVVVDVAAVVLAGGTAVAAPSGEPSVSPTVATAIAPTPKPAEMLSAVCEEANAVTFGESAHARTSPVGTPVGSPPSPSIVCV